MAPTAGDYGTIVSRPRGLARPAGTLSRHSDDVLNARLWPILLKNSPSARSGRHAGVLRPLAWLRSSILDRSTRSPLDTSATSPCRINFFQQNRPETVADGGHLQPSSRQIPCCRLHRCTIWHSTTGVAACRPDRISMRRAADLRFASLSAPTNSRWSGLECVLTDMYLAAYSCIVRICVLTHRLSQFTVHRWWVSAP